MFDMHVQNNPTTDFNVKICILVNSHKVVIYENKKKYIYIYIIDRKWQKNKHT